MCTAKNIAHHILTSQILTCLHNLRTSLTTCHYRPHSFRLCISAITNSGKMHSIPKCQGYRFKTAHDRSYEELMMHYLP